MHNPASAKAQPQRPVQGRVVAGIRLHHSLAEDFSVYAPASLGDRVMAYVIDTFVIGVLQKIMVLPFYNHLHRLAHKTDGSKIDIFMWVLFGVAYVIYQIIPTYLYGQSLGKTFFGIRVVTDKDEAKLHFLQVVYRETLGRIVNIASLGIGYLLMLLRPDKRCLHDLLARTRVIKFRTN